ncbi:hypothetical protein BKA60DRAFT_404839, partial [Fusarium oxysporum]
MTEPILLHVQAPRACLSCRKRKQRCDKALPQCSRCAAKSTTCDYSVAEVERPRSSPADHETEETGQPLVLKNSCCHRLSRRGECLLLKAVCSCNDPPAGMVNCPLADTVKEIFVAAAVTLPELATEYFQTSHQWLPVVDVDRFQARMYLLPRFGSDAGFALLTLSIYLATRQPCRTSTHSAESSLYLTTKRLFLSLQAEKNTKRLDLLQSGLILVTYECEHAMYKQAYITLSICIATSHIM